MVQFSYTFDGSLLSKISMRNVMVYLRGTNLLTLTNYSGYSPEIGVKNPLDSALDQGIYPITRIYSAGINLTF